VLVETAHAKVNLALHVRARRRDGYHELESLFAFCAHGDRLSAESRDDGVLTLAITGPFATELSRGEQNLALRAAHALLSATGEERGASLILDKVLPIASGIGGGSADAAAALRLLVRVWNLHPDAVDLFGIATALGADVPACLMSQTTFGTGLGERLSAVDIDLSGTPILLVNPLLPCPTGPVFRGWDGIDRGPLVAESWPNGRNDLQPPALALVPEIADVLETLAGLPGTAVSRMSGSGATCFALFVDDITRDGALATIRANHPGWWAMGSHIR
jgi:4-diphosphocytidyl-2-C-methyl-D-erythritol kinase